MAERLSLWWAHFKSKVFVVVALASVVSVMQLTPVYAQVAVEEVAPAEALLVESWVDDCGLISGGGSAESPFCSIQEALDNTAESGTVHVKNGTYPENLTFPRNNVQLVGESREGVIVQAVVGGETGVLIDGRNGVVIRHMSFVAGAGMDFTSKAHFLGHNIDGLTLEYVTFNGTGASEGASGLDLRAVRQVTLRQVSAHHYPSAGIAFIARTNESALISGQLTLEAIETTYNDFGLVFFAGAWPGGPGADVNGVILQGANVIANNTDGLWIYGGGNCWAEGPATPPAYRVRGASTGVEAWADLELNASAFSANEAHIQNCQTANIQAKSATFNGKTGNQMTPEERVAFDAQNQLMYGRIIYYDQTSEPGQGGGTPVPPPNTEPTQPVTPVSQTSSTPVVTEPQYAAAPPEDSEVGQTPPPTTSPTTPPADDETDQDEQKTDDEDDDQSKADEQSLGNEWYWWLLALLAIAGAGWWFYAGRMNDNDVEE